MSITSHEIARQRLWNQQIAQPSFTQPGQVVAWLGAIQAQDYLGALWAVGLRMPSATEQVIEQAIAEKQIVRTWPMRGTIHFVAPADARWMLDLLTPRVIQRSQPRLKQLGLDAAIVQMSAKIIAKALEGGKQLTRNELYQVLESAQIATSGQRGLHILGQLAHQQLICFGARSGKQPTFTLFDEWLPDAPTLPSDQALPLLAMRYFAGHGPASIHDLIWWSGLTRSAAKAAIAGCDAQLAHERIGDQEYYWVPGATQPTTEPTVALLPPFDEWLVGYRDRSATLDPAHMQLVVPGSNGIFNPIMVADGRVVGTWKRVLAAATVTSTYSPFGPLRDLHMEQFHGAAQRYAQFVGKRLIWEQGDRGML
jgi:hypothetical protein